MSKITEPIILRDFSRGVYRKSAVNNALIPPNSVAHAQNINFDTQIGNGVVRSGTTVLGTTVASRINPLGLTEFVPSGSTNGLLIAAYSATTNAQMYFYNGAWSQATTTSGLLSNTNYNRFAMLGNYTFRVNGSEVMTSTNDGNTWGFTNCMTTNGILTNLIYRSKSRLLTAGDTSVGAGKTKSRIWFSSIIDPSTSPPTITWNNNISTGDFIDINPDDGSNITGFAETSGLVLIFKDKAMYRLNVITKTVDTDNIFNIGAVSQEAITTCEGLVYFFSGTDIRQTNGDLPVQISRLGVQDWINAIPQANWSTIAAGTDGASVYFAIGSVTMFINQNDEQIFTNVILKFSPRDQTWSVHAYKNGFKFFCQYTTSANGRTMMGSDTAGNVQTINLGNNDNGTAIFYELQTQEQELGLSRSKIKTISDKLVVLTRNGQDSAFAVKANDNDFISLKGTLEKRINTLKDIPNNLSANYFTFKWSGTSGGIAPVFEGVEIPSFTDQGII